LDTFKKKLEQLERALEIANEIFEDDPKWIELSEESKLRFADALRVTFKVQR